MVYPYFLGFDYKTKRFILFAAAAGIFDTILEIDITDIANLTIDKPLTESAYQNLVALFNEQRTVKFIVQNTKNTVDQALNVFANYQTKATPLAFCRQKYQNYNYDDYQFTVKYYLYQQSALVRDIMQFGPNLDLTVDKAGNQAVIKQIKQFISKRF